jgi:hypothetical protein
MVQCLLSREDVIKAFGFKEFQKGLRYVTEGRIVSSVEIQGKLRGFVQGSMNSPYQVKIDLNDLGSSVCSCPVEAMCKHCAAMAIAYADGRISHFHDIEERIGRLTENEAKKLLCRIATINPDVAREVMKGPALTWLGQRMNMVTQALEGCFEGEELAEGCEILQELIESTHISDAPPLEIMKLCVAVATEALDALDSVQGDPYEDLESLIMSTAELFEEAVGSLPEEAVVDAFESSMTLFGRDWKGMGLENLPLAFVSRLGARQIIDTLREKQKNKGPVAESIKRIGIRYLEYRVHNLSGDIESAVEALIKDGASEEDLILAAQTWALHNKWDKSRQVLETGIWQKNKGDRAFLLLQTYFHQGSGAQMPSAQNVIHLLRSIDGRMDERGIGNILTLLRRTATDDILGDMIEKEKLGCRLKVKLLAELGRWKAVEREVSRSKQWDPVEIWKLASMSSRQPDISTRFVLMALSCTNELVPVEYRATLTVAIMNMDEEDLAAFERLNIIKLGIESVIANELATRFPERAMVLLKGCLPEMDPQRLANVMTSLTDKRMAADLGQEWLTLKLKARPRYDGIKDVLTFMRCIVYRDDWLRMKVSLLNEFRSREALRKAFDIVETEADSTVTSRSESKRRSAGNSGKRSKDY